ncbi:MAG: hypothetical protein HQK49_20285 [Oligoflexia bacterium]|nr:hypothetical protein [Oligoflexia bacterium]
MRIKNTNKEKPKRPLINENIKGILNIAFWVIGIAVVTIRIIIYIADKK